MTGLAVMNGGGRCFNYFLLLNLASGHRGFGAGGRYTSYRPTS